jgi:hypothetical protein
MVGDGYGTATAEGAEAEAIAGTEAETEYEDDSDVRLECLKLAVAFCKTKGQPIAVAKDFLAFVLAQDAPAPTSVTPPPDSRTRP